MDNKNSIILTKNYIKNPLTNKHVVIGGKRYKKLVKQGHINGDELYKYDDNILCKIDIRELVRDKIKQLNEKLAPNYEAVIGRGMYKNYIIKKKIGEDNLSDTETVFTDTE